MSLIYEPQGRAKEFAALALNPYTGCTHGCKYCFNQDAPFVRARVKTGGSDYFQGAAPKKNIMKQVRKEAAARAGNGGCPEILLSFVGDVYQHQEADLMITREVIRILIANDLPFTILTKGGLRAVRDFDLLEKYPQCSFGTTLTLRNPKDIKHWEPYAANWWDRWDAIYEARQRGIRTWVSLEPVIDPSQALQIIKDLYPFVDHWKVGKINHMPEIEKQHDWLKFRKDVSALLDSLGADYYLKKSITEL